MPRVIRVTATVAYLAACLAASGARAAPHPGGLRIEVLSNRADVISGGDALVAVDLPGGVHPSQIQMTLGGTDVTGQFATRANGRYEGLLTGLRGGGNVLTAQAPGQSAAHAMIRNHSIGGAVFSGPQVQPWVCANGSKQPKCNAPTTYEYQYKSSVDGQLHAYDP